MPGWGGHPECFYGTGGCGVAPLPVFTRHQSQITAHVTRRRALNKRIPVSEQSVPAATLSSAPPLARRVLGRWSGQRVSGPKRCRCLLLPKYILASVCEYWLAGCTQTQGPAGVTK